MLYAVVVAQVSSGIASYQGAGIYSIGRVTQQSHKISRTGISSAQFIDAFSITQNKKQVNKIRIKN